MRLIDPSNQVTCSLCLALRLHFLEILNRLSNFFHAVHQIGLVFIRICLMRCTVYSRFMKCLTVLWVISSEIFNTRSSALISRATSIPQSATEVKEPYLCEFIVACARLYKPLCRLVSRSVGPSLIARGSRLMVIGLVLSFPKLI